ncbi:integrator complex subunit 12-like [Macrosteles quadrilineatus]|uniref:integrator complex subunit 12-like n=1 Tax=Macrosteles quadrilineatus TaxID=74068 RepID=UPI0023E0E897|nr:integrator complex subunit 12-like [Macrosteles quadrilineatus]
MALTQDMDMAILARSLKLLHSPEEDSAEQLRIILEDTIKCKYGNRKPINLSVLGLNKKTVTVDEVRGKRIKLEEGSGVSPIYREDLEESQTSGSDSDDGVALEILDDDLSCVVCHEMAVGANNNLVECVECHSLYHQECHKPAITQDVNDPRFVWYCATCTKTMNKVASSSKGSPSSVSQSGKPPKASSKSSSSSSSSSKSFNAFASSSSAKSSSGSYSSKSGSSSSHQSSGKSSTKVTIPVPKINTITADKRLQIMKKNAAKKQEKRKLPK